MKKLDAKTIYWIQSFIIGVIFSTVFAANQLYRVQTVGLDALQLVLVGTALEVTAFIFEVPTGIVADVYSRRLSVIIGTFLFGLSFIIESAIPHFGVIVFAQVVMGIGWTFISGAESAWITDEVGVQNVGPIFLRSSQFHRIGNLIGIPLFVVLGNISYQAAIFVGGVMFLVLGIFRLLYMPEENFTRIPKEERENWKAMVTTFKSGINLARAKSILLTFAVIAIFVGLYSEGYDRLSEAHFLEQFEFPALPWGGDSIVFWFAIMRVGTMLLALGATEFVKRNLDTTDSRKVAQFLQGIYGLISLGLLIFAWSQSFYLAILATWLIDTMRSLTGPLVDTWVNKYIETKVRATMLSMTSQLDALGQMAGGPIVGVVGNLRSIRAALTVSALLILPVVPLYGYTTKQQDEPTTLENHQ